MIRPASCSSEPTVLQSEQNIVQLSLIWVLIGHTSHVMFRTVRPYGHTRSRVRFGTQECSPPPGLPPGLGGHCGNRLSGRRGHSSHAGATRESAGDAPAPTGPAPTGAAPDSAASEAAARTGRHRLPASRGFRDHSARRARSPVRLWAGSLPGDRRRRS